MRKVLLTALLCAALAFPAQAAGPEPPPSRVQRQAIIQYTFAQTARALDGNLRIVRCTQQDRRYTCLITLAGPRTRCRVTATIWLTRSQIDLRARSMICRNSRHF